MGRIRQMIAVDGRKCWALFHPCTRNTYVIPSVVEFLKTVPTSRPIRTALGGTMKESNRLALLEGEIEHYPFSTHAFVVEDIGTDEDGNRIEVLFGAVAMKQWGIRLDPAKEKLDLSPLPEGICRILKPGILRAGRLIEFGRRESVECKNFRKKLYVR